MEIRWRNLCNRTGFWLATEIWLNLLGLDHLADYSEFLFGQDLELQKRNHRTVKVTNYPPQFCPKINRDCPVPGTAIRPVDLEENHCDRQLEIFNSHCKTQKNPCVKVWCFSPHKVNSIHSS